MSFFTWIFAVIQNFFTPTQPDVRELPAPDKSRKVRLGIIVGHAEKAPGAKLLGGEYEFQYNTQVARLMESYCRQTVKAVEPVVIFRKVPGGRGIRQAYKQAEKELCDVVIELHFNAFNGHVRGTETLCTFRNDDIEFAQIIQAAMCKVFERDGDSRGLKKLSRGERAGGNVHGFPGGANCVVEPFFGDNQEDALLGHEKQDAHARGLVDAVNLWAIKKGLI